MTRIHKITSIVLLLSTILGTIEAAPGKSNTRQSGNNIDLTRLLDIMSISPYEEEMRRAEMDKTTTELRAMGDGAIEPLMEELRRSKNVYLRHRAVSLLQSIGTSKARESLLQIALGQDSPKGIGFGSSWAARNYVKILKDKSDAKKLLTSNNTAVQDIGLHTLRGVSMDVDFLNQLEGFLQSNEYYLRASAVEVITADPEATLVKHKLSAIVGSLETVEKLPKAREKFQYDRLGTLADNVYYRFINSLSKMKGADACLREEANRAEGNVRLSLIIALGHRGDVSVKKELRRFLKDSKMRTMTMMRCSALRTFETTGTLDDLAFLQEIAQTDPLEVVDCGGPLFEMVDGKIVNTGERMYPVPAKTDPRWSRVRRSYPVRSAAKRAMKLIGNRRIPPASINENYNIHTDSKVTGPPS